MTRTLLMAASTGLIATFALGGAASADPGDQWKKQWEKRAECDKKLYEAKSARDFHKKAAECDRELAKLSFEQRKEAAKSWREAEKKWRERHRGHRGEYYDWDD
jgi:hypothetical protein